MLALISRFGQDESGATMVEYGLLVVLIALVAATGATVVGTQLNSVFSYIGSKMGSYVPAA